MLSEGDIQDFAEVFGQRVRSLRKEKDLTQLDLAAMIDVTDRLIQRIEAGDGFTTIKTAYLIADAFDLTIAELFTMDDSTAS